MLWLLLGPDDHTVCRWRDEPSVVAGLATLVLVEKLFPSGVWIARIGGVLLVAWGARWLTKG